MLFSLSLSIFLCRFYFIKTMCYISRLSFTTSIPVCLHFSFVLSYHRFFILFFRLSPRVSFPFCNDGVSVFFFTSNIQLILISLIYIHICNYAALKFVSQRAASLEQCMRKRRRSAGEKRTEDKNFVYYFFFLLSNIVFMTNRKK